MKTRLVTSFFGVIFFLLLLFAPPVAFHAGAVIVTGLATYEIYSVTGIIKKKPLAAMGVFGIAWCAVLGCMHINSDTVSFKACLLCITLYVALLLAIVVFDHKNTTFKDAATGFFASVAIGLLYSFIIPLRADKYGICLIFVLFVATWCNDAGAYFVGIKCGKTLLAPHLSPKKTVEGAIGGVFGSIGGLVIFALVAGGVFKLPLHFVPILFTGLGCSVLGPVSDLAMSAVKREYGVKDYGTIFPGHGGILDRFDSILLTAPFVYFMNEIFTLVG